MELISIIMPVYNTQDYLEECITSVLRQTYTNIEIIIIDDGSTDKSPFIIDKMAALDNRICTYHKTNEGVAMARNIGIEMANGKFVMFLDSDDSFYDCMVEKLYTQLMTDRTDIAICGILKKREEKSENCLVTDKHRVCDVNQLNELFLIDSVAFSSVNKIYRMECIGTCRFPLIKMCEDAVFLRKVFLNCKRVTLLPECWYINNQRIDSATKAGLSEHVVEDLLKAVRIMDSINNPEWIGDTWKMSPGMLLFELLVASLLSCKTEPIDIIIRDKYFWNTYKMVKLPSKKANLKKAVLTIMLRLRLYKFLFVVVKIYKNWRCLNEN